MPRHRPGRGAACCGLLLMSALALQAAQSGAAISLPADFVAENAAPGVSWDTPVNLAFLPDGRLLVAEKRGTVWVLKNGVRHPTPFWSSEAEVLNHHDRGLLGMVVDPDFVTNRFVYFLYTVDPDSNGSDGSEDAFGRLTRYQMSATDSNAVDPASRTILLGVDWPSGPLSASPSHTIGDMVFGADGSMIVTMGDGAQYSQMDDGGLDGPAFGAGKTDPYEDIGAFRAQYIGSLCGKALRIDPSNGHGYPSNPYWDGNPTSVESRIWAYGLRNPYRLTVRPGTGSASTGAGDPGTVYVGDVGWSQWEEVSVAYGGENFGWPCYEGINPNNIYQNNGNPAHHDCPTIGTAENPATHTAPVITWHHSNDAISTPPGIEGNTVTGGLFYTGVSYPVSYRNQYFFADYDDSWIRSAEFNGSDQLIQVNDFAFDADGPVAFAQDPISGDIFYVAINQFQVRRIRYTGSLPNNDPIAVADGVPTAGPAPLVVTFSSAGTFDPDGDPLTFSWAFGDGNGSVDPNPQHTYTSPGAYAAVLTVADGAGGVARDTVYVIATVLGAFPSTSVLDDFNRPDGPIGGAWTGYTTGLQIQANALTQTTPDSWTVWDGAVFGPNQEVFCTFDAITSGAPEHDLMLKVQGLAWSDGHIEVKYDDRDPSVKVNTYAPSEGWVGRGQIQGVAFSPGDQFGARAYQDGSVELYRNGTLLGTISVGSWPFAAAGGRLGMTLVGAAASRLDNYGGGDAVLDPNQPPEITITSPLDSTFFAVDDTVWMRCIATDDEDVPEDLTYRWEMDLHHNTHIHPNSIVINDSTGFFAADNHDDGTGVWFEIRALATDTGGKTDTATVSIFPEIDLYPGRFFADRPQLGDADSVTWTFRIHNNGPMPSPLSRWRLTADDVQLLAEGDTLVGANDSVTIVRTLPPVLSEGMHVLRVVVDTLGAVVETSEVNNGWSGTIDVVSGSGTVGVGTLPVTGVQLGPAYPNPAGGGVAFDLSLPFAADVRFAIHDLQGRVVWRGAQRRYDPGRVHLGWAGRSKQGNRVEPGLYLARVIVNGTALVRRFVVIR